MGTPAAPGVQEKPVATGARDMALLILSQLLAAGAHGGPPLTRALLLLLTASGSKGAPVPEGVSLLVGCPALEEATVMVSLLHVTQRCPASMAAQHSSKSTPHRELSPHSQQQVLALGFMFNSPMPLWLPATPCILVALRPCQSM